MSRLKSVLLISAVLIIAITAVFFGSRALASQSLKDCLEKSDIATCDSKLFESLNDLADHPSDLKAKKAISLVSALAVHESQEVGHDVLRMTEWLVRDAMVGISDETSGCYIAQSRKFAIGNLSLDSGEAAASALYAFNDLQSPKISVIVAAVRAPSPVEWAFRVGRVEALHSWLPTVMALCA